MVWKWFFMVFGMIFWSPKLPKLLQTIFAKTWKIVIFLKENWYFQGFEGLKLKWSSFKKSQKSARFLDIDFGWLWKVFWRGFERPKSLILAVFSRKDRSETHPEIRSKNMLKKFRKKTEKVLFWRPKWTRIILYRDFLERTVEWRTPVAKLEPSGFSLEIGKVSHACHP